MDETTKLDLQQRVQEAKEQMNVLRNLLANLYTQDSSGNKQLRPNVKEKDIQMLSEAIVKIKTNYKDIAQEMNVMQERETNLDAKYNKTRDKFTLFAKETGVELPSFIKDFYQIDG